MKNLPNNLIKDAFNLPNSISIFRLLLSIPVFIVLSKINENIDYRYFAAALLFIAFLSDILDGFFARKKNIISEFGKIIDPLADKAMILVVVVQLYLLEEILPLFFWVIILRDVVIFIGGIYVSSRIGKVLPSNLLGKITVLVIALFLCFTVIGFERSCFIYHSLFYLSIILSLLSVIAYALRGYEAIKWNKNGNTR